MATLPAWLQYLQANPQHMRTNFDTLIMDPSGNLVGPGYQGNDATAYNAMYSHGGYQGENSEGPSTLAGYRGYQFIPGHGANAEGNPAKYNGKQYTDYDAQGNQTGTGTMTGLGDGMTWKQGLGMIAASALGGHLLSGLGGAEAAALGQNGAFLGEGVASGVPGWDAAMSAAGAGGVGAGAAGATAASTAAKAAAGASGLGAASSLLGAAAPLLGAAAGAQGQEQTSTQKREPWEPLQPYIMGLLQDTDALRKQQMPQAQEIGGLLMNQGKGLLSQPVAGNGYGQFANRRF